MKIFNGSLTLVTPPLASAKLVWSNALGAQGEYPLTVANNPDDTTTVSTSAALPRGVIKLLVTLANTACCPRAMNVWSPGCDATTLPAEHSAGSQLDTGPVPSCNPA